jgi:alkylated DNA repair dioxygenase AlkB
VSPRLQQPSLFGDSEPSILPGLATCDDLITEAEAEALTAALAGLPFTPFEFGPFTGARRIVSFGWRYDFGRHRLEAAEPMPDFLAPAHQRAAAFAGLPSEALRQVLVTEYQPGAGIGWHRDRPQFGQVIGVSLGAPAVLRFRRREGAGWDRCALPLPPRSAYHLAGEARSGWEHSIAPGQALRYSITFRTLVADPA